jgi:hypothetical protein
MMLMISDYTALEMKVETRDTSFQGWSILHAKPGPFQQQYIISRSTFDGFVAVI